MTEPTVADTTAWWSTGVTRIAPGEISLRGYPVQELIGQVDFVSTIWLMVRGELPDPRQARLLETALVASVDHGPQAPSIASARMAITCGVGINSAMANGINTLGDVHGGAGQQCVALLTEMRATVARESREVDDVAAQAVADHRARRAFVPGFGHRFHPVDPRRDVILAHVERAVADGLIGGEYLVLGRALERQLAAGAGRAVPMNIDGISAIVYAELGFEPELARGLFVLARSVGILAHAWEERNTGRRIKGPLPPPLLADYTGPTDRPLAGIGDAP
ncbi:MAG: citryl-CoA lyase [Actinobacteria bacterium]|nr:citryl-CoA lyase [Actinomycetota bacterium]